MGIISKFQNGFVISLELTVLSRIWNELMWFLVNYWTLCNVSTGKMAGGDIMEGSTKLLNQLSAAESSIRSC
jgi:hypothetical protein